MVWKTLYMSIRCPVRNQGQGVNMFDSTKGLNSNGWWSHTRAPLRALDVSGMIDCLYLNCNGCYCSLILIKKDNLTGEVRCLALDHARDNVVAVNDWSSELRLQLLLWNDEDYGTKRCLHAIA